MTDGWVILVASIALLAHRHTAAVYTLAAGIRASVFVPGPTVHSATGVLRDPLVATVAPSIDAFRGFAALALALTFGLFAFGLFATLLPSSLLVGPVGGLGRRGWIIGPCSSIPTGAAGAVPVPFGGPGELGIPLGRVWELAPTLLPAAWGTVYHLLLTEQLVGIHLSKGRGEGRLLCTMMALRPHARRSAYIID